MVSKISALTSICKRLYCSKLAKLLNSLSIFNNFSISQLFRRILDLRFLQEGSIKLKVEIVQTEMLTDQTFT